MTSKYEKTDTRYLEVLRNVSGEQKLRAVFEMWETAMELKRASVLKRYPGLSREELKEKTVEEMIKFQVKDSEEKRKIAEGLYRKSGNH